MDVSEISRLPAPSLGEASTMAQGRAAVGGLAAGLEPVTGLEPVPGLEPSAGPEPGAGLEPAAGLEPGGGAPAAETYQPCDECGTPVDKDQRYCVACGAHRRHVNDPAARYLTQAAARSRTGRAATAGSRTPRSGGRSRGLGTALALALIPVVAAVGVMVGRSSNNNDARLIQQLAKRQAAVVTTPAAGSATTASTATAASTATGQTRGHAKTSTRGGKSTSATKNGGKVLSTTQNGSVTQIAGSKPTQAQEQQGAQATQQVQKSTGKSYVNGQSGLPATVVVP